MIPESFTLRSTLVLPRVGFEHRRQALLSTVPGTLYGLPLLLDRFLELVSSLKDH